MIKIIDVVPVSNTRKNPQSFINKVEKQGHSITLITGYGAIYAPVIKRIAEAHLTTIERNWHVAIKDSWEDENVGLRQWFVVWSNGKKPIATYNNKFFPNIYRDGVQIIVDYEQDTTGIRFKPHQEIIKDALDVSSGRKRFQISTIKCSYEGYREFIHAQTRAKKEGNQNGKVHQGFFSGASFQL